MKPKIIVVPDVHGRTFWKDVLPYVDEAQIIFLGDYLDPYHDDALVFNMTQESVIQNFEEIINLKRSRPNSVTLLLGNHDCEYIYGRSVCDVRCDKQNYGRIQTLFRENKDCFQIAAESRIAGKPYIFSHAGLHMRWLDDNVKEWTAENMVSQLNKLNAEALACPDPEQTDFAKALAKRDKHRSGKDAVGSPIWADAESYLFSSAKVVATYIDDEWELVYFAPTSKVAQKEVDGSLVADNTFTVKDDKGVETDNFDLFLSVVEITPGSEEEWRKIREKCFDKINRGIDKKEG